VTDDRRVEPGQFVVGAGQQEMVDGAEEQERRVLAAAGPGRQPQQEFVAGHATAQRLVQRRGAEAAGIGECAPYAVEVRHAANIELRASIDSGVRHAG
jgi:hypothetical protein